MNRPVALAALTLGLAFLQGCGGKSSLPDTAGVGSSPTLPKPDAALIPVIRIAPARGWPAGQTPQAAAGLAVTRFAADLDHPRWLYVLPNGDVLVAETNAPAGRENRSGIRGWVMNKVMTRAGATVPSADRITLLRDADGDGTAEVREVVLENLHSPFGMALVGNTLYVANTDALLRFAYEPGATRIQDTGTRVADLPGGEINHHWTKNVIASSDGSRLYVTSGSNSNAAERGMEVEEHRAAILEVDPATGATRLFASGLRNPNGLAWHPHSGELWTAVNERDEIGNDLVPDYITSVKDGGFYGWPYSYYGQNVDERVEPPRPDLVAKAIPPDYAVGAHVAALGLTFVRSDALGANYRDGAFVGLHGSWNRNPPSGYKVIFVPFSGGKPNGAPQDVLTGFLDSAGDALGRPVGVAIDHKGALLVADDVGNVIWRVTSTAPSTASPQP
ncbi:sorbosone dehydrogenase family protein [Povalibacter sp.]|uniref:PQQ-dependent sugar dehydrogenase n=1 Tax=Povalibacter sp. TaxID=1962978 RepID=UPI0032C20FB1